MRVEGQSDCSPAHIARGIQSGTEHRLMPEVNSVEDAGSDGDRPADGRLPYRGGGRGFGAPGKCLGVRMTGQRCTLADGVRRVCHPTRRC